MRAHPKSSSHSLIINSNQVSVTSKGSKHSTSSLAQHLPSLCFISGSPGPTSIDMQHHGPCMCRADGPTGVLLFSVSVRIWLRWLAKPRATEANATRHLPRNTRVFSSLQLLNDWLVSKCSSESKYLGSKIREQKGLTHQHSRTRTRKHGLLSQVAQDQRAQPSGSRTYILWEGRVCSAELIGC